MNQSFIREGTTLALKLSPMDEAFGEGLSEGTENTKEKSQSDF